MSASLNNLATTTHKINSASLTYFLRNGTVQAQKYGHQLKTCRFKTTFCIQKYCDAKYLNICFSLLHHLANCYPENCPAPKQHIFREKRNKKSSHELQFINILHPEIFPSKISKYLPPLLHHLANHCPQNRPCLICICSEKGKIFKQKGSK